MKRVDEIDIAVGFGEEKCLVKMLFDTIEVDVEVLWEDLMLVVIGVSLTSLVLDDQAMLRY